MTLRSADREPLALEDREAYRHNGYLVVEGVLSPAEVEAAKAALSGLVEELRHMHRSPESGGNLLWRAPNSKAAIQFERDAPPAGPDDPQAEAKVRKFFNFAGHEPFLTRLACEHPRIMGVVEGILGDEPLLMQDMALVKPPFIGIEKPWHQDNAYFSVAPLDAVCGVWIALDAAEVDNGCMHVLPGGHRRGALRHHHDRDCEIVPQYVRTEDALPIPLAPGGALFFSGMMPHFTRPNRSPQGRRALQFHYRAADSRVVERDEYDALFAETDGTPASCAAAAARGF